MVQSWFTPAWLSEPLNILLMGPQAGTVVLLANTMSLGSTVVQEMLSVLAPRSSSPCPAGLRRGRWL